MEDKPDYKTKKATKVKPKEYKSKVNSAFKLRDKSYKKGDVFKTTDKFTHDQFLIDKRTIEWN